MGRERNASPSAVFPLAPVDGHRRLDVAAVVNCIVWESMRLRCTALVPQTRTRQTAATAGHNAWEAAVTAIPGIPLKGGQRKSWGWTNAYISFYFGKLQKAFNKAIKDDALLFF